MKRAFTLLLLLAATGAGAQVTRIIIPAGTPEDQALQAVTNENDAQKRIAMLQDFVQKFSANAQAVAYGNWQLAQQYADQNDNAKALEYGEKALALQPNNLDILVFVSGVAQKMKANDKLMDFAVRGAAAFNGITNQQKPADATAEEFALKVKQDQDPFRQSYEFLEVSGFNAMMAEQDAKRRMGMVEKFIGAFHESRFEEQVMQLAVYTLGQLKDSARLASFAEKALAGNPNNVSTLLVLADAFAEFPEPSAATRAESYARKALEATRAQTGGDASQVHLYSGMAHSSLGYALMKQEKTVSAIAEFKTASAELKDIKDHPDAYAAVLYRLGFAYAKTGKLPEAKAVLTEAVAIQGPYQEPSRDLLAKVQAAPTKRPGSTKKR
jgi:tetratricopeptide (TPR) repeat protein